MTIRQTQKEDQPGILKLYKAVAENSRGIARNKTEVNENYVQSIWQGIQNGGLGMVAILNDQMIGEIHASSKGIAIFNHVLAYLTVGVHPDFQGKGVGKLLFQELLSFIEKKRPDIYRVELESRASNIAGIRLYESVGFTLEGRMKNQTRNIDGSHEDGVAYAWFNKNYQHQL